jgi:hypothetical protein
MIMLLIINIKILINSTFKNNLNKEMFRQIKLIKHLHREIIIKIKRKLKMMPKLLMKLNELYKVY